MRINTHKKRPVNLYLDVELVEKAKKLGLNISKISENALKEAIRRLTQTEPKMDSNFLVDRAVSKPKWVQV